MVEFSDPTEVSIRHIVQNMRAQDVAEVEASSGMKRGAAVKCSVRSSELVRVASKGGVPFAVYGLVKGDLITQSGTPWLLGTNDILRLGKSFTKKAREVIADMLEICPVLTNKVHVDNTYSVRWLKRMGFRLEEPEPSGVNGEMFHRFSLRKREYV